MFGGAGNVTLDGDTNVDILWGDGGNDILLGKNGNDELNGGQGNDELDGDRGNDILEGGTGLDTLLGGDGRDLFVLKTEENSFDFDTILDFEDGRDTFGLKDGLTFDQLSIIQGTGNDTNNTFIELETSGQLLAALIDVEADSLTSRDFTTI
jgi:glycerophosphoryl diester phosphodiesterase